MERAYFPSTSLRVTVAKMSGRILKWKTPSYEDMFYKIKVEFPDLKKISDNVISYYNEIGDGRSTLFQERHAEEYENQIKLLCWLAVMTEIAFVPNAI